MTSRIAMKINTPHAARRSPTPTAESPASSELLRRAIENPATAHLGAATIMQLQRTHGNQFVSRMIQSGKHTPDIQACPDCGDEEKIHTMRADTAPESAQHGPGCGCGGCGHV